MNDDQIADDKFLSLAVVRGVDRSGVKVDPMVYFLGVQEWARLRVYFKVRGCIALSPPLQNKLEEIAAKFCKAVGDGQRDPLWVRYDLPGQKDMGLLGVWLLATRTFADPNVAREVAKFGIDAKKYNYKLFPKIVAAMNGPVRLFGQRGHTEVIGPVRLHFVGNTTAKQRQTTMRSVERVIEGLRRQSPLVASVLYGDIVVGATSVGANVAGFYAPWTDMVYTTSSGTAMSEMKVAHIIAHELGHRYWQKVLAKDVKESWEKVFSEYKQRGRTIPMEDLIGMVIPAKEGDFRIIDTALNAVLLDANGNPTGIRGSFSSSPDAIRALRVFPTQYAGTNPEEFFCEVFGMVATGELPAEHMNLLERLIEKYRTQARRLT
jgi:hypothetical protein